MAAQIIDKPWGSESILSSSDLPYTVKILHLNSAKRLSLQYHDQKTETLVLFSGKAKIQINEQISEMTPLAAYTITPGTIHRIEAVTDCQIFEASTGEKGTTFRLEDDSSRPNESETVRNLPNRGWSPS